MNTKQQAPAQKGSTTFSAARKHAHRVPSQVDVWEEPPPTFSENKHNKSHIWVRRENFYCADDAGGKGHKRKKKDRNSEPFLLIGFDTEYKAPSTEKTLEEVAAGEARYEVLSYQFHCRLPGKGDWSGICCPEPGERMKFGQFLVFALGKGREAGFEALPTRIILVGHFTRADVSAFSDFLDLTDNMAAVRNTFISDGGFIPVEIKYPKKKGTTLLRVQLRDTMLLAPGNSKSLAALGDLVGQPKIVLDPDPKRERYLKQNMDVLRSENWPLFKRYAMNDAIICVEYAEKIMDRYRSITGSTTSKLPVTLTSIGVDLLESTWTDQLNLNRLQVVGKEEISESYWDKRKGYFVTASKEVELEEVHWWSTFVTECYHGGRNEQFWFGPGVKSKWTDYDLSSAYPTAMSMIGRPDWKKIELCRDLERFGPTTLGFACVDFEFPDAVRFPTLPVRTDNGLVFPKRGSSYCAAPELVAAKTLGAKLTIRHGVIVPTDNTIPVFGDFIKFCLDELAKHAKNTLDNLFWKELSNSTYGKTAQGLKERRVYDLRDRTTKLLPPSRITNPFFAGFITSYVRAILGEILNLLPAGVRAFSCTTDGLLTNANKKQITVAQSGPLAEIYRQARKVLTGQDGVLEAKHEISQPLGWRTRGQATLLPGEPNPKDPTFNIVLAKAGIYTAAEYDTDELENRYIVDLFFDRTPEQLIHIAGKTGIRDMVNYNADFVDKVFAKSLNMEFDWKRAPSTAHTTKFRDHVAFDTVPWDTVEEFHQVRDLWEEFQGRQKRCIKTLDDFQAFNDFVAVMSMSSNKAYLRTASDVPPDLARLRQLVCSAWHQGAAGFEPSDKYVRTAQQFCNLLCAAGIPCKRSDIQNAFKKSFISNWCPQTTRCVEALNRLKTSFPQLNSSKFFSPLASVLQLERGSAGEMATASAQLAA